MTSVRPNALDNTLHTAARRIRIALLLRYSGRALCWSALPCAIAVGLSKFQWYDTPSPLALAILIGLAVLTGVILAFMRPLQALDVAKLTERRTDLKERLSSAVEFRSQGIDPGAPFYGEQMSDANRHAGSINLKQAFPIKLGWELPVGALCALAVFLAFYLPTLPRFWTKEKIAEMAEVKRTGIAIEKVAKEAEKAANEQKLDETKKAALEAKKLAESMQKGKVNKKEALVKLANLTKQMEEKQQQMAQAPAKKSLDEAHKDFQKALDKLAKEKEDEAKKAAETKTAMQNAPKRDVKNPGQPMEQKPESNAMKQAHEALQQMADALANQDQQQMQQAMEKMAQQIQKGEMSKEEMQQMQQALQQLAQSLQDTNQQEAAQQMQQLAQMMQNGNNIDPKTLQQMAAMMRAIGQKMGKGQNMAQMMDAKALGDLAQALKEGRMTMAMNGKMGGMGRRGKGPGKGFYGHGGPTNAMKDPGQTSPILVAMGKQTKTDAKGKTGSAKEFAAELAKVSSAPKHLPNGKIAGMRSENGQEQQMNMMGDPNAARSNSPYYQVVQTSKRQAESTLNKENIPASLKKQVKDYFDSIKP